MHNYVLVHTGMPLTGGGYRPEQFPDHERVVRTAYGVLNGSLKPSEGALKAL